MNIARAFQPEICTAAAVRLGSDSGCLSHAKPRSREVANGNAQVRCSVFGRRAADGSPRVLQRGCRGDFCFQLSPVCSLWHGCHRHGLTRIFTDSRGKWCLNHEWTRMDVGWALQPEICAAATGLRGDCNCGASSLQAVLLTRSREVAKGNAQGRCLVFSGRWSLGKPRTVVRGCGARKFCSHGGTRIVGRLKSRQNS